MTTQTPPQALERYGEARYRYQDGTLAQVRQTQTFVRGDDEDEAHFEQHILTWCARFDVLKQPEEYVELVKTFHGDRLTRATIVVQPDEPSTSALLHAIERVLKTVKSLIDMLPRRRK